MFIRDIIYTFVLTKKIYTMKNVKSFCIIKKIVQLNGKTLNVVLLDSNHEVLEFNDKQEAQNWADILTGNSDSGWEYIVKEI